MATFNPSPPPSPLPRSDMTLSRSDMAALPPEIVACILALIQRPDIFSCVLVSKAWFEIFGPKIWREVVLYRKHSGDLLYDPSRRYFFQAGLARNGHWVQTFWSDFYSVLDLIVVDAPAPLSLATSVALNAALDSSLKKSSRYPSHQNPRVLCYNLSTIYLGDTGLPFEPESSIPSPSSLSSSQTLLHSQASGQLTPTNLTTGSPSPDILDALTTMALASPPPTVASFSLAAHTPPPTPPSQHTSAYQPKSGCVLINLLVQVLKANPYLKSLDVRAPLISGHGDDWSRHRCAVPGVLRKILKECPSTLQDLALWFPVPDDIESDLEDDEDMFGHDHYTNGDSNSEDSESDDQPLHELLGIMALKSIEIVHPVSDFYLILSFLARCPNLESIYLRDLGKEFDCEIFSSALRRSCRQLCRLEIDWFSGESDQDIAHLINSSFSGWKYLRLDNPDGFGPLATRAVMRHAHSLEQLLVPDCGGFHSRDLQRFLTYAPNLWNFEGTTSNEYNRMPIDVRLSAQDLIDSKWACQRLQRLVLVIDQIPRPLIRCRYDGRPFTDEFLPAHLRPGHPYVTVAESRALQREPKFILDMEDYQDFDGLTHRYVARGYQYECLELTLESGLDLLAGLTSLRVLNVTRMAHRIGINELEWMNVHWPNLKTIAGLVRKPRLRGLVAGEEDEVLEDEQFDDDEGLEDEMMEDEEDDLEIERVRKWVEEHPYGIGSSFDALNRKTLRF
ncbi:hypothetical protein BG006_008925 [Podila minutissima]|uniref:F-box domain-containing protein n=1 Tax=Podila minutissima TaxID=64525 RepID=A0A9P5SFG0_9FUNG|nr:hypothetical protein BG006_008925 [Podila minutissima]